MSPRKNIKPKKIYQFKVTLNDIKPEVWRRIQVKSTTTLEGLHDILQIVMGWEDYHLNEFKIEGNNYGIPDEDDFVYGVKVLDEASFTLRDVIPLEKNYSFNYIYDFGDNWNHTLIIEEILQEEKGVIYPRCIDGEHACPPEDVGGDIGYSIFLEAISNPSHPDHEWMLNWTGGKFNPYTFNLKAINSELSKYTPPPKQKPRKPIPPRPASLGPIDPESLFEPFNNAAYHRLDFLLNQNLENDEKMDIAWVHGYLTGICCKLTDTVPSEWLPEIIGDPDEEPPVNTMEELQELLGLIFRLYNHIIHTLREKTYTAYYRHPEITGEIDTHDWCVGFMLSIDLISDEWKNPIKENENLIMIITSMMAQINPELLKKNLGIELTNETMSEIKQANSSFAIQLFQLSTKYRKGNNDTLTEDDYTG